MNVFIVIIGLFLLFIALQFIKSLTIKGFTCGIAKAQLKTYKNLKKRNPELEKRNLYIEMIYCRPGYSKSDAEAIIKRVEEYYHSPWLKNNPYLREEKKLNLRNVVLSLIQYEFFKRTGQFLGDRYPKMYEEVIKIIPENL